MKLIIDNKTLTIKDGSYAYITSRTKYDGVFGLLKEWHNATDRNPNIPVLTPEIEAELLCILTETKRLYNRAENLLTQGDTL